MVGVAKAEVPMAVIPTERVGVEVMLSQILEVAAEGQLLQQVLATAVVTAQQA
jgi:hypothetical protein